MRFNVFIHSLGVNWVIVTIYVPASLVSSLLIFMQLLDRDHSMTDEPRVTRDRATRGGGIA